MRTAMVRRRSTMLAILAAWALAICAISAGQSTDPFIGTWNMDAAKSSFKPGPAPKSATLVIEAAGKAIKVSVDAAGSDGSFKWGFTAMPDGKDVPVTDDSGMEMVNLTQSNPNERITVYKNGGRPVITSKAAVAKDGQTMTITQDGTNDKGETIHNVIYYVKQ